MTAVALAPSTTADEPPRRRILAGDAIDRFRDLPDASIDCVITSPPYFRLRNYGVEGQYGAESSVDRWVSQLRDVAAEVARVMVPTGTFWLNVGDAYSTHAREGAPRKSLLGAPEQLMLALVADGWTVRNKIVWAKRNTVPSSVRDRLSTTHEFIYVLTRQPSYFFDLDAVRVPHTSRPPKRPRAARPPTRTDWIRPTWLGPNSDGDAGLARMHQQGIIGHPLGKNPGDVWQMSVSRYRGAHFATYPEQLVRRMLQAGCPETRCVRCRAPWRRVVERHGQLATRQPLRPTCHCNAPGEPGLVLDPFLGSGTTAVVAEQLDRDWLGIELNPEYIALAEQRIDAARASGTNNKPHNRKEVT